MEATNIVKCTIYPNTIIFDLEENNDKINDIISIVEDFDVDYCLTKKKIVITSNKHYLYKIIFELSYVFNVFIQ